MSENIELDLDALVAAAEAATVGHRRIGEFMPRETVGSHQVVIDTEHGPMVLLEGNQNFMEQAKADAAYAAAAQPSVVLELVRRLRIAEQMGEANLLKISASEGDTLVIRYTDLPMAEEARRGLAGTLPPGVRAVLLPPSMEISALDENAMRAAGWVLAERGGE